MGAEFRTRSRALPGVPNQFTITPPKSKMEEAGYSLAETLDYLHGQIARLQTATTGSLRAYKSSDEAISSTTLQDDDALVVTLAASTTYRFRFFIFINAVGSLEGFKAALGGTAGVTSLKAEIQLVDDVSNTVVAMDRVTAFASSVGAGLSLGSSYCIIDGTIETSTAGTFLLSWAQNGGAGLSSTSVQRNSYMIAEVAT